jgi:outer membrane protein assembly factor BamD (BamD/ComL family)
LRLLAQANAATREGRHADALRVLDQHAREFPRGQLAPERDYKRAKVTCELGQVEAARKLAKSFLRDHPRSPMRGKAREICREPAE